MDTKELSVNYNRSVKSAIEYIRSRINYRSKIGVILGSGMSSFAEKIKKASLIPIPFYPSCTIAGHTGSLVSGKIDNIPILAFQGRVHLYESDSIGNVIFPIVVAKNLGIRTLIITNAAGGINPSYKPGDIMLITDHINLTNQIVPAIRTQRYRHKNYYDIELLKIALRAADKERIPVQKGIYCGLLGPSYETKAEVKMIRTFGADAVGMSTVNEVIFAEHLGIRILGCSIISNLSSDLSSNRLSHADVIHTSDAVSETFYRFIRSFIIALSRMNKP